MPSSFQSYNKSISVHVALKSLDSRIVVLDFLKINLNFYSISTEESIKPLFAQLALFEPGINY
jgi:hypothetical protein